MAAWTAAKMKLSQTNSKCKCTLLVCKNKIIYIDKTNNHSLHINYICVHYDKGNLLLSQWFFGVLFFNNYIACFAVVISPKIVSMHILNSMFSN